MPSYINPNTIDLNTQKSAPELQSNFDALQAALNGGLDEVNVPNLSAAFTTWKPIQPAGGVQVTTQGAGGSFLVPVGSYGVLVAYGTAGSGVWSFPLDPAGFAANARTTKIRLRTLLVTNAVAPTGTFTASLNPVATYGGASGALPSIATAGAAIVSNAYVTPGASNGGVIMDSTEANFPALGRYHFQVTLSGAMAAGSTVTISYELQMRQV